MASFVKRGGRIVKRVGTHTFDALWHFTLLSSNGYTEYTTSQWEDRSFSCNCPGWTRSALRGDDCRHVKYVKFYWNPERPLMVGGTEILRVVAGPATHRKTAPAPPPPVRPVRRICLD